MAGIPNHDPTANIRRITREVLLPSIMFTRDSVPYCPWCGRLISDCWKECERPDDARRIAMLPPMKASCEARTRYLAGVTPKTEGE